MDRGGDLDFLRVLTSECAGEDRSGKLTPPTVACQSGIRSTLFVRFGSITSVPRCPRRVRSNPDYGHIAVWQGPRQMRRTGSDHAAARSKSTCERLYAGLH